MDDVTVISLGGSLIIPDEIDTNFLKGFKEIIVNHIKKGRKFVIITGGGKVCRRYNDALLSVRKVEKKDLDWMGIHATRLNAHLVRLTFGEEYSKNEIITGDNMDFEFTKPIVFGGGLHSGQSSDAVAVEVAKKVGAKKVINLSNTDYVYDSDPKKNSNAKKIEKVTWAEYRKLIPEEWDPGLNSPFDPIASKMAEEEGITVVTMNGKRLDNLEKCLDGEEFMGTTIY